MRRLVVLTRQSADQAEQCAGDMQGFAHAAALLDAKNCASFSQGEETPLLVEN
jgi:hypothetical protein